MSLAVWNQVGSLVRVEPDCLVCGYTFLPTVHGNLGCYTSPLHFCVRNLTVDWSRRQKVGEVKGTDERHTPQPAALASQPRDNSLVSGADVICSEKGQRVSRLGFHWPALITSGSWIPGH